MNPQKCIDKRLGPYNQYPNVVITGNFPCNYFPPRLNSLNDYKSLILYGGGLPRISSTPLTTSSLYNRNPWIDQGSLQTSGI
jgi:hypothetical protein